MEKQEIVSGLKNALDRGYSLEMAMQSFVNAGYSRQDVEDSMKSLGYNSGIISHSETSNQAQTPFHQEKQETIQNIPQIPKPTQSELPLNLPGEIQIPKTSWLKENWKIILLFIILLALLGVLAWMIFK